MRRPFLSREGYGLGDVDGSPTGTAAGGPAEAKPSVPGLRTTCHDAGVWWAWELRGAGPPRGGNIPAAQSPPGGPGVTGRRVRGLKRHCSTCHSVLAMKTHRPLENMQVVGGSNRIPPLGRKGSCVSREAHARFRAVGTDGRWHQDFRRLSPRSPALSRGADTAVASGRRI